MGLSNLPPGVEPHHIEEQLDDLRECDGCGRQTVSGGIPDWINGECEDCDPSILTDPENLERIGLRSYLVTMSVRVHAESPQHACEQAAVAEPEYYIVTEAG